MTSTAIASYFRPVLTDLTVQLPDHMIIICVIIAMTNISMVIIKITVDVIIVSVKRSIKPLYVLATLRPYDDHHLI